MSNSNKPKIKLLLTFDSFNTLFEIFAFYVKSEAQAGETFYSINAEKFMSQFAQYGNFIEKKNEKDSLFLIYLFEVEVVRIMKMYNKYIGIHQSPNRNYFAEYKKSKTK